jgi:hypothetical protein
MGSEERFTRIARRGSQVPFPTGQGERKRFWLYDLVTTGGGSCEIRWFKGKLSNGLDAAYVSTDEIHNNETLGTRDRIALVETALLHGYRAANVEQAHLFLVSCQIMTATPLDRQRRREP